MSQDSLYRRLLDRAYSIITPRAQQRAEIPKLIIETAPRKTIIRNFLEVASRLRRDPSHMSRFFLKEMAVPGAIEGNSFVIYAERNPRTVEMVYERYIKFYVVCPVCNSIDTELLREGRIYILHCTACGANTPRKGIG